jgi:hypothetical protein
MGLGVLAPVRHRVEQLRIQARQASKVLGVYLIGLVLVGVDEPQLACVGHQDLVTTLIAMRIGGGCSEAKRRLRASGVVRSLPSSIISPLS